jgi:Glycosyltransferases involved in cell wall biogenesis
MSPIDVQGIAGVPNYIQADFFEKRNNYCLLIPIINENGRIIAELKRALEAGVSKIVDIAICDGGSTDGSTEHNLLVSHGVRTLLVKTGAGKQGAQLRTGIHWGLTQGYNGIITVDGNNKDSIEDVPLFIKKLEEGYDYVQGSRYVEGGNAINTPLSRHLAVKLLHAPITSVTAGYRFTDTTNAFRAYSREYLEHPQVQPLRDVFVGYELLAYLSTRGARLRLKVCEIPVTRAYPIEGTIPTKINGLQGNANLLSILFNNAFGKYNPPTEATNGI